MRRKTGAALPAVIEEYLSYLDAVRGVSAKTLEAYRVDLVHFAEYCVKEGVLPATANPLDVRGFVAELGGQGLAEGSVNRALSAIRGFYRWQLRMGYRKDDPSALLRNLKMPQTLPSFLWESELASFARLPDSAKILWPEQDKAMTLVMYSAGLRISELTALSLDNIEDGLNGARVLGKGGRERYVFFPEKALEAYLPARLHGQPCDRLFINHKGAPISIAGVHWIIGEYAKRSGLGKNIHRERATRYGEDSNTQNMKQGEIV